MFDTAVAKCRVRPKLLIWEQELGDLQPRHSVQPQGSPRTMLFLFMRQTLGLPLGESKSSQGNPKGWNYKRKSATLADDPGPRPLGGGRGPLQLLLWMNKGRFGAGWGRWLGHHSRL